MSNLSKILFNAFLVITLSSCGSATLKYAIDPEFDYLKESLQTAKVVAVTVADGRGSAAKTSSGTMAVAKTGNVAQTLRSQLVSKLKAQGYKIISKPLLADVAYDLVIQELELSVNKSMLKTTLLGKGKILLTLRKHGESLAKTFSATRTQEVANPATDLDATGVINQMLSRLFANMFSDQALSEFAVKPE